MRSALSVILSSPVPDNKMSHPDYEQTAHDHATILILLKPVGTQIKQKTVSRVSERIAKCGSRFTVIDSANNTREILARFVKEHPVENNEWGDFQTHRRLLGLITFGKYENQIELNELCRLHETLKVKYVQTLYDSRAILFGPKSSENLNEPPEPFTTPHNFKTIGLFYNDESCPDLEAQMSYYFKLLYSILESKRLERSREKIDKVALLKAPFEKKDFIGLDLESRNNRKRCIGRATKHLGDLCLQAGLPGDALNNYNSAAGTLQAVNDWLWLGAAYEGLCAVSALILYPNMCRSLPLQRNSSLQEGSPGKQSRRGSQATATLPLPPTVEAAKVNMPHILPPEEIWKKYREAIVHYSKYQNAGIIETEASFKATRISIEQNCTLQAASFLSNVLFNNMIMTEQEKIDRFTTLSDLYTSFGYTRKASFCLRHAASRHVSQNNPNPDWQQCYNLLLQATSGFKLSLDPVEMSFDTRKGWPSIQIHLINELVAAANRMGHPALATRHLTFLLQTMYNYLTPTERKDAALQLQAVSQQCEGAPVPLVLDSGTVIPPANLTNIPRTKSFTLKNLQPHLQPQKIERVKEDHGPFLFTPINFGSLERKSSSKSKVDYLWVDGDICEVSMQLVNPLPFELHVSNMRLLTNGVVFESIPESITLSAESSTIAVTLAGTPREVGELEILGFSTHTLGVKSNCRLRHMDAMPHPLYTVEVVPALPKINIETSLPRTASFSSGENIVTSASISLYGGESAECTITITNISQVTVEMVEISVQSTLDSLTESKVFKWSEENLQTQLPLQPQTSASITLYMYGAMDFVVPQTHHDIASNYHSQSNSLMSQSGPSSLPSRLSSPSHHTKRHSELTSSFRSGTSSNSSNSLGSTRLSKLAVPLHASNIVEGQLRIRYSGSAGLAAGYCRVSSVFITIEMLPSVQVTSWDVLPAEIPTQFYLVLDVTNMTNHEMELHYTQSKCIYMEGRESCRIPIPVDRCPLNKLSAINGSGNNEDLQKICSDHIASLADLKWQLLGTESSGKATLVGLTLTQDMLDLVRMSPLQWEVTINDTIFKAQDEVTCSLGECVSVGVGVSNALENPLRNVTLSINLYQDHHNGVNNYRLDTRVSIAGANKVMLPTLQESGRAYHECRVVFLTAGQYKIDIQCSSRESTLDASAVCSELANAGHTWRYIPPIEIKVEDC